jgi:hypothetical protein
VVPLDLERARRSKGSLAVEWFDVSGARIEEPRWPTTATLVRYSWAPPEDGERVEESAATRQARHWIGMRAGSGRIRAERAGKSGRDGAAAERGSWAALIDIPEGVESRGLPSHIGIEGVRSPLGWHVEASPSVVVRESLAIAATPAGPVNSAIRDELSQSPLSRWLARLSAGRPVVSVLPSAPDRFESRELEALASQLESQWGGRSLTGGSDAGGVLVRLESANPAGACELVQAISGTCGFLSEPVLPTSELVDAPLWSMSLLELLENGHALLDGPISDVTARAGDIVQLAAVRGAWVVDDAGTPAEALGAQALVSDQSAASAGAANANRAGSVVTIGVIWHVDEATAASVRALQSGARRPLPPEFATIDARSMGALRVACVPVIDSTAPMPGTNSAVVLADVRVGPWEGRRAAAAFAVPARPPGLSIGPLVPDWTMRELADAVSRPGAVAEPRINDEWATIARLARESDDRWLIYVECRHPLGTSLTAEEIVVALGPAVASSPLSPIVVRPVAQADSAQVQRDADRWSATIPIPASAVDDRTGTLRLAITRTDASGARSSWPRPMLPWQTVPARALVDMGVWDRSR